MMMGPTKKKIIITGVIAFLVPTLLGTAIFFKYKGDKEAQISQLKKETKTVDRFVFADNMIAGEIITAESLKGVKVKAESAPKDSYESGDAALEELVGKRIRINAEEKTIITKSMLVEEYELLTKDERLQEFNMVALPSDLEVDDYIDLRITMSTGEDYLIVSGKKVEQIGSTADSNAIFLKLNEEEILRTTAAVIESYLDDSYKLYANKYVDPSDQLYNYVRINYVERYKEKLKELIELKQLEFDTENNVVITNESGEQTTTTSGDSRKTATEADIETASIANLIGLTESETQDIRNAIKENNETVLDIYKDKLVVSRTNLENTYPVKTNIAQLIQSDPNILDTLKAKYNIAKLEEERANLMDFPLIEIDDYGYETETEAFSKLRENINSEIATKKAERKEYLQALILEQSKAN